MYGFQDVGRNYNATPANDLLLIIIMITVQTLNLSIVYQGLIQGDGWGG